MINGVMQIGIGVSNAEEAFEWYKKAFGTNIRMFDDEAEAALMTRYTGGEVYKRRAILAMNKAGGAGFEIWQFTNRTSSPMPANWQMGQGGINAVILKASNLSKSEAHLKSIGCKTHECPFGDGFYVEDPYGNPFKVQEFNESAWNNNWLIGGGIGAVIGVADLEKAAEFYENVFGLKRKAVDSTAGNVDDLPHKLASLNGAERLLMEGVAKDANSFGTIYPHMRIELVKTTASQEAKLFENRFWGDLGFIHFCFDITNMSAFEKMSLSHGVEFTVDSKDTFNMEDSGGHFTYLEDPDGTLIELIEVHRVPIIKKFGVYLDLKKRKRKKVPRWMIKTLLKRQEKPMS